MSGSSHRTHSPSSAELSDWFHKACRHEVGALQQLLLLYRPLLLKLAQRRLRGPLQVKVSPSDLVQTSVWKATQAFPAQRFDERRGFLAWLVTILNNEAADVRRKYRHAKKRDVSRERPLDGPEARDWLSRLSASLYVSDSGSSERDKTFEYLARALPLLPPHYRLVLRLRYYEKFDFSKIASRFERSYDAVRLLHNRALKRLRSEIELLSGRDSISDTPN